MKNIILILTLLFACNKSENQEADLSVSKNENYKLTDEEIKLNNIEFVRISKSLINDKVKLSGKVDVNPNDKISIYSNIEGKVKNINVIQGDNVKKGDLLFEIENSNLIDMKSNFIETTNELNQIEKEFKRQSDLYKQKAISEKEYIEIEKKYKNTLNHLNYLKKNFEYLGINYESIYDKNDLSFNLKIRSNYNGQVGKVEINNGKYIEKNNLAMEVYSNSQLHVELQVPSNYINSFNEGDMCKISFQNNEYDGKIYKISRIIEDKNNMFLVHIHFAEDVNVPIGSFVNVVIESNSLETHVLNKEFVFDLETNPYVYLYENGEVVIKKVKVGRTTEENIEILNYNELDSKKIIGKGGKALASKIN